MPVWLIEECTLLIISQQRGGKVEYIWIIGEWYNSGLLDSFALLHVWWKVRVHVYVHPDPGACLNIYKDKPHKSARVTAHVESHTHLQPPSHTRRHIICLFFIHTPQRRGLRNRGYVWVVRSCLVFQINDVWLGDRCEGLAEWRELMGRSVA